MLKWVKRKGRKMTERVDLLKYETELYKKNITRIAGVDEVGRGPLVGPVVAAAVILPQNYRLEGLTDSKKLSEKKRNQFFEILKRDAIAIGIGEISAKKIDEVNIYEASKLAMLEALNNLKVKPEHVLIDAMPLSLEVPSTSIIHGDALSLSIAAASVIAKVTRDEMMYALHKKHPEYHFDKHKGYPTKLHLECLEKFGPLENYRLTYKPVHDLIEKGEKNKHEENHKKQTV